jgi:uncharacterized membrane protein
MTPGPADRRGGPDLGRIVVARAASRIRDRVLAGMLLALPFLVTIWILVWLYRTLDGYAISPAARLVIRLMEGQSRDVVVPEWFATWVAPPLGTAIVLAILYLLGFFAKTRVERLLDSAMLRLPFVTRIYRAVRGVFASLSGHGELHRFQRVVLVAFPQPGMRVPGFVTASCRDQETGRTILSVYVPTTPIPTSGYMILVPEEEVTDLDWSIEETIQAVVSFGIAAPQSVRYFPSAAAEKGDSAPAPPPSLPE